MTEQPLTPPIEHKGGRGVNSGLVMYILINARMAQAELDGLYDGIEELEDRLTTLMESCSRLAKDLQR